MILAAGLGTRLRPLTDETPKPLMWLGDRPQIDHITAALAAAGLARVVVNTHHLPAAFDDAWAERQPLAVDRIFEPEILGQGGGIANAKDLIGEGPLLAWNADIVTALDVRGLAAAHEASGAAATLVVGPPRARGEGTLGLSSGGDVRRVRSLVLDGEVASADYAGIAVLSQALRDRLPTPGCVVADGFIPALERGERLATFELRAPFVDIGSPAGLLEANRVWLRERGLESYVDPTAVVGPNVVLRETIVARAARINGSGALERVLVFPSAAASAPQTSAIITPTLSLRISPLTE